MGARRGQAALEYAMIIGLVLITLIPVLYISFTDTGSKIRDTQASDVVSTVAGAANTVYSLGPGSSKYISIDVPEGVVASAISDNQVGIKVNLYNGVSDVFSTIRGNVSGAIPITPGLHRLSITYLDNGVIYVGEVNDTSAPIISNIKPASGSTVSSVGLVLSANTNEYATCRYSNTNGFDYFTQGTPFSTTTGQTSHISPLSLALGAYSYYIKCNDTFGNLNSNLQQGITAFTVSDIDSDFPIISLVYPNNGSILNYSNIRFNYSVSDTTSSIASCTLSISSNYDNSASGFQQITDTSIFEDMNQTIQASLDKGNHTWSVICSDSSPQTNTNISLQWWVRVNMTLGTGTIDSCPNFCISLGKVGNCDNTPSCHGSYIQYPEANVYCEPQPGPNDFCCCSV